VEFEVIVVISLALLYFIGIILAEAGSAGKSTNTLILVRALTIFARQAEHCFSCARRNFKAAGEFVRIFYDLRMRKWTSE
jgi:hypothetical protein